MRTSSEATSTGGLTRCLRFKSPVAPSTLSVNLLRRVWEIGTRLAHRGTSVYILLTFHIVIDLNGLLSILGSSDIPAQDLRRCLANGHLLSLEDQDRVKWIMRSPGLRKWLNHPRSKTILVNGKSDRQCSLFPHNFSCRHNGRNSPSN